jgi:two-component system, NarL family, nitrate/nitrite response regulator NarL
MKILVADDHPLYREAVRVQIERLFDGVAVFEVPSLEEASALASGPEAPFDLFLIDFSMPGMSLAALSQLTRSHPNVPIAVISGTADAGDVRATIQAGARGFIPKTASGKHFAHAIELLLAGGSSVPADLMLAVGEPEKEAIQDDAPGRPDWLGILTARELDVLKALTRGLSNKEVGRELGLAEVTIKLHLRSIFRKMGARSRSDAAVIATKAHVGG